MDYYKNTIILVINKIVANKIVAGCVLRVARCGVPGERKKIYIFFGPNGAREFVEVSARKDYLPSHSKPVWEALNTKLLTSKRGDLKKPALRTHGPLQCISLNLMLIIRYLFKAADLNLIFL